MTLLASSFSLSSGLNASRGCSSVALPSGVSGVVEDEKVEEGGEEEDDEEE